MKISPAECVRSGCPLPPRDTGKLPTPRGQNATSVPTLPSRPSITRNVTLGVVLICVDPPEGGSATGRQVVFVRWRGRAYRRLYLFALADAAPDSERRGRKYGRGERLTCRETCRVTERRLLGGRAAREVGYLAIRWRLNRGRGPDADATSEPAKELILPPQPGGEPSEAEMEQLADLARQYGAEILI